MDWPLVITVGIIWLVSGALVLPFVLRGLKP